MPISIGTTTVTALFLGTTSITSAYLGNTQVFGGSFTPLSLFSGGAQGIWLDPSDLSTMFSDRAGTTPVTTPGTVVGLRLDKSKGLTLGAEKISNGGPFANTTGWSPTNATVSAVSNELVLTTTAGSGFARTSVAGLTAGRTYKIVFTARRISGSGGARISVSGIVDGPTNLGTTDQTLVLAFLASGTTANLDVNSNGGVGDYAFSSISVRELAGNHAVAPTDAARPTYGVEPKGGRRNLLTWSEDFGNAVWQKGSATITANTDVAPDGTTTADTFTATGSGANLFFAPPAAAQYALSFYVKRGNSDWVACSNASYFVYFDIATGQVGSVGNGTASIVSAGNGWYRCVWLPADTTQNNQFRLRCAVSNGSVSTTTQNAIIWGAQLELGSTATAYQRVTTAYDVTESGVVSCHYVQYDGSDDSMSTAAIDFTATDKMSVFAGVRKLSDAATSIFLETATDVTASAAGSFAVFAPNGAGSTSYQPFFRGDVGRAFKTASPFVAPISSVLAISMRNQLPAAGDAITTRVNGVENIATVSSNITDAGNFGNWPMYIGRRNNTLLPFNGRDFGIIIVGKAASAGEITDTETWLAAKTAQVTL